MKDPISILHSLGQSLWYDNIQRSMLENGELKRLIDRGELKGMTSNPSIFNQAIAKSNDYDAALKSMAWAGYDSERILDELIIEDIRAGADLFLPLYKKTNRADGYVSIEVHPEYANDTAETLKEAIRLWVEVNRPNTMIKIPATKEGLPAVRQAIADGLNVNITLIFSIARYLEVMDAYLSGLEQRLEKGLPIDQIASVASFFVSRIDSKVDKQLESIVKREGEDAGKAASLMGKAAIANARLAYAEFKKVLNSERFERLKAKGAKVQRPLWASTSTKNPAYPDTLYVDELAGPDTVNTVPQVTLDAFRSHGEPGMNIEKDTEAAKHTFRSLEELGISIERVTEELELEGVTAFGDSFSALSKTVEERRKMAVRELGELAPSVAERVSKLEGDRVPARIRKVDPTLWTEDSAGKSEIRKRMGWLTLPDKSRELLPEIKHSVDEVRQAGYQYVVLLGMGGSSLAPEVNRLVFGVREGYLDLIILDSTDPGQVHDSDRWPVEKTFYIVSSKSGTTAEVSAAQSYFWAKAVSIVGNHAGEHFIAITDPGTSLEELARERNYRRVFHGDPKVGGRYSVLSAFGLVPAGLIGIDLDRFLNRGAWMMRQCGADIPTGRNPGLVLGAVLGEAAFQGKDKLTLIAGPMLAPFGSWLEQLVAESSGKQGIGIIPVDGEVIVDPAFYGTDRLFVYLRMQNDPASDGLDAAAARLLDAGHPVLTIDVQDPYDLGAEYYRWEYGTAVACAVLGVNAFDQPDVQDSKSRTGRVIDHFHEKGKLEESRPVWKGDGVSVYGQAGASSDGLREILRDFLKQGCEGDYIAINAYLPRNPQSISDLLTMRTSILKKTRLATTVGFGPRFQHSTGQLHKGGKNNGLFVQITADPISDIEIPGEGMTFGVLELAQAAGDLEALLARDRRAIRIHLRKPADVHKLVEAVEGDW